MKRASVESDREKESVLTRQSDTERGTSSSKTQDRSAMSLHRRMGNQAVQRLHENGVLRTKLTVNRPDDRYEREADRVAEHVMRMLEPAAAPSVAEYTTPAERIQRMCPRCQRRFRQGKPLNCSECEERLQRKETSLGPPAVDGDLERQIQGLRGGGRPLSESERSFFEPRFGTDFSGVRVHTGSRADEAARSVNAEAFTMGQNVTFRLGMYRPETTEGRQLLAHELVHVIQQQSGAVPMVARQASFGEKWDAFWGAGPIDAYRAKELAKEALKAAQQTGLPGIHNGPADAWRHCYWNCRMVQVIGEEDAADIAKNHEKHGGNPTAERMMDTWNNEEGRECSDNCDTCCQSKLDNGNLWVLYGGKVGSSKPTLRTGTPSGSKYEMY